MAIDPKKLPEYPFMEMYILGEIGEVTPSVEEDARVRVPRHYGGTSDAWLEALRNEFVGSTVLDWYVRRRWARWKAERVARGENAFPEVFAADLAQEHLAAEHARFQGPARGPDGKILCMCKCGNRAEVEFDGNYLARACWERELEKTKESGLPADFGRIERELRELDEGG